MPNEKRFRFTADAVFFATDLDDALAKLAEHFRIVADVDSDTTSELFLRGQIKVEPEAEPVVIAIPVGRLGAKGKT